MGKEDKIILIIIYSFIALFVTANLSKTQGIISQPIKNYTVSENWIYTNQNIELKVGYATTYQKIFSAIKSPYINLDYAASLNNETWSNIEKINFTSCNKSTDTSRFTYLGYINPNQLQSPNFKINEKYLIPPQTRNLPLGITEELAKNSIAVCVIIKPDLTFNDIALRFMLFLAIIGILLSITEFLMKKKR